MRLGMGLFTHFTDTQIFIQITGCQLVQKTGVAKGPSVAKGQGVTKGQGVAKGLGLAKGAGASPTTTSKNP